MNTIFKKMTFPFLNRYHALLKRVNTLEIVQDTLLFDTIWRDDPTKYLNGQLKRQAIIKELNNFFDFKEIIETGTFLGNTTGFFASLWKFSVIQSCESDKHFHTLAKMRLSHFNNVNLHLADSRQFLFNSLGSVDRILTFFYLDAHWGDDLPLKTELEIIKQSRPNSVIMIDDFEVLGDSGYSYDDYGRGKSLTFRDFGSFFKKLGYVAYNPVSKSTQETGFRRGSVIIGLEDTTSDRLDAMSTIRKIV